LYTIESNLYMERSLYLCFFFVYSYYSRLGRLGENNNAGVSKD
jgi:hypothetical protein